MPWPCYSLFSVPDFKKLSRGEIVDSRDSGIRGEVESLDRVAGEEAEDGGDGAVGAGGNHEHPAPLGDAALVLQVCCSQDLQDAAAAAAAAAGAAAAAAAAAADVAAALADIEDTEDSELGQMMIVDDSEDSEDSCQSHQDDPLLDLRHQEATDVPEAIGEAVQGAGPGIQIVSSIVDRLGVFSLFNK